MKTALTTSMVVTISILITCACTHAQDISSNDALLEALVKKKILTPDEAEKIKADTVVQDQAAEAQIAANKVKLSAPVKEMELYGELRLRYFYNEAQEENTGDHGERNRYRYRLRLGANIKFADNLMFGVMVEANNSGHSGNATFGDGVSTQADAEVFDKASLSTTTGVTGVTTGKAVTGFDAKTGKPVYGTVITGYKTGTLVSNVNFQDSVFFTEVFMQYKPFDWLNLIAGKMANPLESTRMVWGSRYSPGRLRRAIQAHPRAMG